MIKLNTKNHKEFMVIPQHKLLGFLAMGVSSPSIELIRIKDCDYRERKANIDSFIKEARLNPNNKYRIISNFNPMDEIAPMFALPPSNCVFPKRWIDILGKEEGRDYWFG